MRVLLDHCVPQRLRGTLRGHEVSTAADRQWDRLRNGDLLRAAADAGFEVVVTTDQNLRHQQNRAKLPIAVVILCAVSNDFDELVKLVPRVLDALAGLAPRQLVEVR